MRLRWKLFFLAVLAVGGGLVWQNEDAKRQLFRELGNLRDFLNQLAAGYEAWQVGPYLIAYLEHCVVRRAYPVRALRTPLL